MLIYKVSCFTRHVFFSVSGGCLLLWTFQREGWWWFYCFHLMSQAAETLQKFRNLFRLSLVNQPQEIYVGNLRCSHLETNSKFEPEDWWFEEYLKSELLSFWGKWPIFNAKLLVLRHCVFFSFFCYTLGQRLQDIINLWWHTYHDNTMLLYNTIYCINIQSLFQTVPCY